VHILLIWARAKNTADVLRRLLHHFLVFYKKKKTPQKTKGANHGTN